MQAWRGTLHDIYRYHVYKNHHMNYLHENMIIQQLVSLIYVKMQDIINAQYKNKKIHTHTLNVH